MGAMEDEERQNTDGLNREAEASEHSARKRERGVRSPRGPPSYLKHESGAQFRRETSPCETLRACTVVTRCFGSNTQGKKGPEARLGWVSNAGPNLATST